jgi:hypothetical protein
MTKIKLQGSDWKIKVTERSRGRMKLTIKLSKDEAQGFKNWSSVVKPDQIAEEDFLKQVFFNGIEHLNDKLQKISEDVMKDAALREQLAASGINVPAPETDKP